MACVGGTEGCQLFSLHRGLPWRFPFLSPAIQRRRDRFSRTNVEAQLTPTIIAKYPKATAEPRTCVTLLSLALLLNQLQVFLRMTIVYHHVRSERYLAAH